MNKYESDFIKKYNTLAPHGYNLTFYPFSGRIKDLNERDRKQNEEEINSEIQKQIQTMPNQAKQVAEYYQKNHSAVESLRGGIYEDKIISLIKKKAKSTKKTISIQEAEKIILDQNKEPKKSGTAKPKIQKTTTKTPKKRKKVSKK